MDKLKIEYVDINSIKPYENNPRKNAKNVGKNGFRRKKIKYEL